MKRIIGLISMCALMVVVLSGCGAAPQATPTPVPTNTPAPTNTPEPTEVPDSWIKQRADTYMNGRAPAYELLSKVKEKGANAYSVKDVRIASSKVTTNITSGTIVLDKGVTYKGTFCTYDEYGSFTGKYSFEFRVIFPLELWMEEPKCGQISITKI